MLNIIIIVLKKKYYSLEDKQFAWPYIEHGLSHSSNVYLTTLVQKCSNFSKIKDILGECPPQKEIDEYLNKYIGIYLHFTDIQVDPTNYELPFQKYLQTISSKIGTNNFVEENYIYYSPLKIRTKEGSFLGKTKDINSFFFDYNIKDSKMNIINNALTKYYHFIQNNVQIYERIYNNIFDLFSEIGGVVQFIFYIFFWSNFIYNKYIIAYDTYSLFFSVQNEKSHDNIKTRKRKKFNFNDKNNLYKNKKNPLYNNIRNNNKNKNFNNNKDNIIKSNTHHFFFDNNKIFKKKKNVMQLNTDIVSKNKYFQIYQNFNKNLDLMFELKNIDQNSSNINLKENNILIKEIKKENSIKNNGKIRHMSNKEYINKMTLSKRSIKKIEHNELKFQENIDKGNINYFRHFSFIDFIKSLCIKTSKGSHNFLTIFRKHLLSEEHIFKNHIKIVLLEKNNNLKMNECTNILESYNEL